MESTSQTFADALRLITTAESGLLDIVRLSLVVTLPAVAVATALGIGLGALLVVARFPGRRLLAAIVTTSIGVPPVVVGLALYLLFFPAGPLSVLDLLYSPQAMVIAQVILITPIVAAISRTTLLGLYEEYRETLAAMRASTLQVIGTLIRDARPALATAMLIGAGRGFTEVGAVLIVGGNIENATQVMSTAIVQETSAGSLSLAIALGLILLAISLSISALVTTLTSGKGPLHA